LLQEVFVLVVHSALYVYVRSTYTLPSEICGRC